MCKFVLFLFGSPIMLGLRKRFLFGLSGGIGCCVLFPGLLVRRVAGCNLDCTCLVCLPALLLCGFVIFVVVLRFVFLVLLSG